MMIASLPYSPGRVTQSTYGSPAWQFTRCLVQSLEILGRQLFANTPDPSAVRDADHAEIVHAVPRRRHAIQPQIESLVIEILRSLLPGLARMQFPEPRHIPLHKLLPEKVVLGKQLNAQRGLRQGFQRVTRKV